MLRKVRILLNPLKVLYIFYSPKNETLKAIHEIGNQLYFACFKFHLLDAEQLTCVSPGC